MSSQLKERSSFDRELIDYDHLEQLLRDGAAEQYQHNSPYPHIAIENFLTERGAQRAYGEIVATPVPREKINYSTYLKYRQSDRSKIGPEVGSIIDALNSDAFLSFVERLTGIPDLLADPTLEGGGIHRIGTGGFLKIHTDFNFHRESGLFRRLNILVYLNPDWDESWGGALELYVRRVVREIGSLTAVLGGLDMLAFTAGVGEHSAVLRARICEALAWLGIDIDDTANAEHGPVISRKRSGVLVAVEPTNEEWIAARHALRCVGEAAAECTAPGRESN